MKALYCVLHRENIANRQIACGQQIYLQCYLPFNLIKVWLISVLRPRVSVWDGQLCKFIKIRASRLAGGFITDIFISMIDNVMIRSIPSNQQSFQQLSVWSEEFFSFKHDIYDIFYGVFFCYNCGYTRKPIRQWWFWTGNLLVHWSMVLYGRMYNAC